jgi:hypothetical protein
MIEAGCLTDLQALRESFEFFGSFLMQFVRLRLSKVEASAWLGHTNVMQKLMIFHAT